VQRFEWHINQFTATYCIDVLNTFLALDIPLFLAAIYRGSVAALENKNGATH